MRGTAYASYPGMVSHLFPAEIAILAAFIPLVTLLLIPVRMVIEVSVPSEPRE